MRLFGNLHGPYGPRACLSKVLAAFLFLATPACAAQTTVLALGDSLTQGYGLPEAEGFVPQLAAWLDDHGAEARVINGGVSGDTSAGGAARVAWSLTDEVDAMIVTLGGNDMLRGIDPAVTKGNLATILDAAAARDVAVLLVGMRAPGNFGPDYKRAFDSLYRELAGARDILFFEDFLKGLGEGTPDELAEFLQPDGIHPNAAGVRRIVEAIGPAVLRLIEAAK